MDRLTSRRDHAIGRKSSGTPFQASLRSCAIPAHKIDNGTVRVEMHARTHVDVRACYARFELLSSI